MKKSQILLRASAFILAIAAAFCSKASTKFVQIPGFTSDGSGICHNSRLIDCITGVGNPCKTNSGLGKTLYTADYDGALCGRTLRTIPL